MGKDLIIVESPAKVKTIKKFLGNKYAVEASVGHIRDLPKRDIGVDEENGFVPRYTTISGKEKIVDSLQKAAAKADTVYLAPDPDREGEAIAWHISEVIKEQAKSIKRIQFNEITAKAVREALEHPREIDPNLFEAQQARRVLDRLVGYRVSPLLWKTIKSGISAGRVQSVALRLIVERKEERQAFVPEEYWLLRVHLSGPTPPPFKAELNTLNGKKAKVVNQEQADKIELEARSNPFTLTKVEEKERKKSPPPPFTTSTLQQGANQRLDFSAKRTMSIAQKLYEGVELDGKGTTALITYMRTDSVRIADEALVATKNYILDRLGKDYLAPGGKGRVFKSKGGAQDAHEAIRPVDVSLTPEEVKSQLSPEQYKLYSLIWSRFTASQMAPAVYHDTTLLIKNGSLEWKAKGERLLFPGYLAIGQHTAENEELLPKLDSNQELKLDKLDKEQKFTQPPPCYNEASLVRELEEKGIGRPSTYASIISTIQDREYVRLENKHFIPTELGHTVCAQLIEHFPDLMDVGFTARMENNLDEVADGHLPWDKLLSDFSRNFYPTLSDASQKMKAVKAGIPTELTCPKCAKQLIIRFGKTGEFLTCSGYPGCQYATDFYRDEKGVIIPIERQTVHEVAGKCPDCNHDLLVKKSHTGSRFLGCSNYPSCKHAEPFSTKVPCPKCGQGAIVEKSSHRGKLFYACDQYPKCDYALWNWPVAEPCPLCDSPLLIAKETRAKGKHLACPKCAYTKSLEE